jgi:hypothetical protein
MARAGEMRSGVSGVSKLGAGLRLCPFLGTSCTNNERVKNGNIRKFVAVGAGRWLALDCLGVVRDAHR